MRVRIWPAWALAKAKYRSPRGDLKRELVEELHQKGTKLSGRQRKKLRKALARRGDQ